SWRSSARSLPAEVGPWTLMVWLISHGQWSGATSIVAAWAVSFFVFDSMPSTTKPEQRWFVFAPLNLSKDSSSVKVSAWWRLCSMALVRVWIRSRWNPSCRLTLGLHLTPRARPVWILKIIGAAPVRPDVRQRPGNHELPNSQHVVGRL